MTASTYRLSSLFAIACVFATIVSAQTDRYYLVPLDTHAPFRMDVETMLPAVVNGQIPFYGGALQTYLNLSTTDSNYATHLPFGATFVRPVAHGRVELFGGIGGIFADFRTPYAMTNAWMVQTTMGVRVALDEGRHVWVGTTTRYITDFADKKRQWVYGSADLTLRFGK